MRLVGFAGSLRAASYNRALLAACAELAPAGTTVEPLELRDVPLYDADLEAGGFPSAVQALRDAVSGAEGLVIATPEYNAGMPAATKNAVDWLSRRPAPSPLDGTPVLVIGVTPGRFATTRAQAQLRGSLVHAGAIALPRPEVLVAGAGEKFVDGRLVDEETRTQLERALSAFVSFAARLNS